MKNNLPTAIDLFCGAGGMSLGFEQAGTKVLAAFDLEQFNIDTHTANFPSTSAFSVDLSKETGDSLRKMSGLEGRQIDIVFGGPPCQGFSCGGRRDVDDERNQLVFDFARLVREIEPTYFVMENVKGLLSENSKPILSSLIRRVKRAGYSVVEPIKVLNAADYGVPQRRWRTFVLGYRRGAKIPIYPDAISSVSMNGKAISPTVSDAIRDLPNLENHDELFDSDVYSGELPRTKNPYARLMRSSPLDRKIKRDENTLTGCLRTIHSLETVKRFKKTPQGKAEPVSRYIRLAWDSVAPTIRAGTGSDRGSYTAPRPIHPEIPRCISAREAARLHSLPDWFELHGTRWHAFRQIGNSVPPLLARAVADSILSSLKN